MATIGLRGITTDDELFGGPGHDTLSGGNGADILRGNEGDDFLDGTDTDDAEVAGDSLVGGEGDDTLRGDGGDLMAGQAGTDHYEVIVSEDGGAIIPMFNDFIDAQSDRIAGWVSEVPGFGFMNNSAPMRAA